MAYQYKPDLDPLERESREIERRRARYEERKARILHPHTRTMGIDTDSLSSQIAERQSRERAEQERDAILDHQSLVHAKLMTGYEDQRKKQNRARLVDLAAYRKDQQAVKAAADATAKLSYTSYNTPPSSSSSSSSSNTSTVFLQFAGEDPTASERRVRQQQQQSGWIEQQLQTLELKEKRNAQEEQDYYRFQQQILAIQQQNVDQKRAFDQQRRKQFQSTNFQLAAEKKERERIAKELDGQMNQYELTTTLRSAFLNEEPGAACDVAPSFSTSSSSSSSSSSASSSSASSSSSRPTSSPTRSSSLSSSGSLVAYGFKGFSASQRQAILDEQALQQSYNRSQRVQAVQEEKEYAEEQEKWRRESLRKERVKREQDARRREELAKERKEQEKEKYGRELHLKKVVYTNPVSEEFFNQFGTSCR